MNAKELAEFLQTIPPDTVVSVVGYEGGIQDVRKAKAVQVLLGVNPEDYYGPHEEDTEAERASHDKSILSAPRVLIL